MTAWVGSIILILLIISSLLPLQWNYKFQVYVTQLKHFEDTQLESVKEEEKYVILTPTTVKQLPINLSTVGNYENIPLQTNLLR